MGPPSYMRSVVDRNVVMRRIPVFRTMHTTRHGGSAGTFPPTPPTHIGSPP